MKIIMKILVVFILMIPALILTALIWLFGGWTKGFYYMPNPMYALINWIDN